MQRARVHSRRGRSWDVAGRNIRVYTFRKRFYALDLMTHKDFKRFGGHWILGSGIALGALLPGCAGGTAETNVRMPAAERPDISPSVSRGAIRIPGEVPFNYPRFSSGQEGPESRGSAVASAEAGANCVAEVKGEGKAWGSFQLGYAFDHQETKVSQCVVRVRLKAEESASASAATGENSVKGPEGSVNLVFFMKDSMGLTIKEESLATSTLNRGPRSATTQHDFVFDAELQPERGYYVVVSGRAEAISVAGAASRVDLKVSDVDLEIRWADAPVKSAQAETQDP